MGQYKKIWKTCEIQNEDESLIKVSRFNQEFLYTESVEIDDDLDVVFQKGVENDLSLEEASSRKRSNSGQAETGSASKKVRLSQTESDIIELWDADR